MKFRLFWMIVIGLVLASILLFIVQLTSAVSGTSLSPIGGSASDSAPDSISGTESYIDETSKSNANDTGLTPVFFRTISEYGPPEDMKLRINGTSEPNAVLTLLSENTRLRQFKSDAAGNWDVVIDIDPDRALALEIVMFVEGDLSVRGDETIYRLPVPNQGIDTDFKSAALIMVSAPGGPSRIVQSPFGGSPTNGPLSMGPIDYDDSGGVILSGTTEAEGRVRIYAGGEAFGETRVGAGGRWNFIAGNLLPRGEYPIAAELIDAEGVKARVSVPFERLPPSIQGDKSASDLPDAKYEPYRWQVRRVLVGGGHQTTAIFAPIDADALIVTTEE